jgi:hypothetical protein
VKRVIIETPYAADSSQGVELNLRYLRACMHDALVNRGEAPFASHGLYTQPGVLRDERLNERTAGIYAGFAWRDVAEITVVYTDLGISRGMQLGIEHAQKVGCHVEYRTLGWPWTSYSVVEGSGSVEQDRVEMDGARSWYATDRWGK